MKSTLKCAVLGAGKMGETLIKALLDSQLFGATQIIATAKHAEPVEKIAKRFGIAATANNSEAVRESQIILLCVKPQAVSEVLTEIKPAVRADHLLISIVASATTAYIEKHFEVDVPIVRTMPNTPSLVREGMTALCAGRHADTQHLNRAQEIFRAVGRTLVIDEKHFDAVTALSASGPAYIYIILESLAEGGVKVGLPREVATELAAQMCLGASKMALQTKEHPALLKDAVTTPAGCTIDGVLKLEEGGLRVTLIKAVVEAAQRASQLIEN